MNNINNFNKNESPYTENNSKLSEYQSDDTPNTISDLERDLEGILAETKESFLEMMKSIEENLRDSESNSETKKVLEKINQDFQEVLEYNMNNLYKQSSIKIEEE
jgi:predicted transcriptional regulator